MRPKQDTEAACNAGLEDASRHAGRPMLPLREMRDVALPCPLLLEVAQTVENDRLEARVNGRAFDGSGVGTDRALCATRAAVELCRTAAARVE